MILSTTNNTNIDNDALNLQSTVNMFYNILL